MENACLSKINSYICSVVSNEATSKNKNIMTYLIVETDVRVNRKGTIKDNNVVEEFDTLEEAKEVFAELSKEKAVKCYSDHKETILRLVSQEIKPYNERRNEHYSEWTPIQETILNF